MHPTDIKSSILVLIIAVLAILLNIYSALESLWCLTIIVINIVLVANNNNFKIIQNIILIAVYSIIGTIIIIIAHQLLLRLLDVDAINLIVLVTALIFVFLLHPSLVIEYRFEKWLYFIQNEKDNYHIIKGHPKLICKKHLARTTIKRMFIFKNVQCRVDKTCSTNNLEKAEKLVGLIGENTIPLNTKKDYYVAIWNDMGDEVIQGDYDIIEIREHENYEDYDKVITKVISYFYNEIDRYKPINKVEVRIIGNPKLSENTKRLLENNFLKIEYASNT